MQYDTTEHDSEDARPLALCIDDPVIRARLLGAARVCRLGAEVVDASSLRAWLASRGSAACVLADADCWVDILQPLVGRGARGARVVLVGADAPAGIARGVAVEPVPLDVAAARALLQRAVAPTRLGEANKVGARSPQEAWAMQPLDLSDPAYAELEPVVHLKVDVLITGETGCGKDCMARWLHARYAPKAPFIAVNCAAIPETLAEAELFGHEAGAFTGALKARPGHIAEADGGVLYLDEIDSCPLWLQAKLLRALQDKGAARLGSSQFRPSDFRLVASTKVPLWMLVEQGRFRSDLYYRLKVVEVELQPIRHQPGRLLRLFERMVAEAARDFGCKPRPLEMRDRMALLTNHWPGNLRELRAAAIKHALGLPDRQVVAAPSAGTSLREALDACERALIESALQQSRGNVARASRELGIPVNSMHYRLRRLEIDPQSAAMFMTSTQ